MLNIGWFATGRGEGSRGLLKFIQDSILAGKLDARIEYVFSNREPGEAAGSDEFFRMVQGYDLPLVTLSSAQFRRDRGGRWAALRDEYDAEVMGLLESYSPKICVLAGYMLIVGGAMCRRYPLLNLHPALPDGPTGTWQEVIWTLIELRARRTGAMVHLATEEVDRGPVVSYCTAPITGPAFDDEWRSLAGQDLSQLKASEGEELPLFQLIRQTEYYREPYLLLETLRAISQRRLRIDGGTVLDADGQPVTRTMPQALCLDREIDVSMAQQANA